MRAALLILFGTLAFAANPDTPKTDDVRWQEIATMRLINTAAMRYAADHQEFPTWEQLVRADYMADSIKRWPKIFEKAAEIVNLNDASNFLPNHIIRWTLASDRRGYEVSLSRVREKGSTDYCTAPTWFSNDSGVIYQAYSLDCQLTANPFKKKPD